MTPNRLRNIGLAACAFWLVIPAYGLWELVRNDGGDDWEVGYTVYVVALTVAVVLTVAFVAALTHGTSRPRLRTAGLVVGGLGTVLALVGGWAIVVWMPVLGLAFSLLALPAAGSVRGPIAVLAAGQFAGFAVAVTGAVLSGDLGDGIEAIAFAVATASVLASVGRAAVSPPPVLPAHP